MAITFYDMVKASTATTGSGSITVGSAVSPYRAFSGVVANGVTVRYLILDSTAWERGYGVYTSSSGVLTRTLECSSTGSLLNLSGSATVEIVMGSDDASTGLFLLGEYTASAASYLTLTSWYSTRFDEYEIHLKGVVPGANDANMQGHISTDNGSTWDTTSGLYDRQVMYIAGSGVSGGLSQNINQFEFGGSRSNVTNKCGNGIFRMVDPGGSTHKFVYGQDYYHSPVYTMLTNISTNCWRNTAAYNGIRFYINGSTISGTARIYGVGK